MIDLTENQHYTFFMGNYISSVVTLTGLIGGVYGGAQISSSASTDILSEKDLYPFFTRIIPPDRNQAEVMVAFLKSYYDQEGRGWNKLAIIVPSNQYGIGLYNEIQRILPKEFEIVEVRNVFPEQIDVTLDLQEVKRSGARVILALVSSSAASAVFVTAKEMGMIGAGYV
jgi:ABC-type branched-subunit amino acid transport system substrate-binding protein